MSAPAHVVMRRIAEREAARRQARPLRLVPPSTRESGLEIVLPEPAPERRAGCVYCSRPTSGRAIACHAHADLPKVDPFFSPDVPQKQDPAGRLVAEALPDRVSTKGR